MIVWHPRNLLVLKILFILAALVIGFGGVGDSPVSANGKATLISTQEQGPYKFEVSILPSRAVVNNTHLSLRIIELSSDVTLTEGSVNISATGPGQGTDFGPIVADNNVLPQFFETTLPFDAPGVWQVSINASTELGEETIQLPLDVREGRPINLILVAAIAVAVIAVGIWTFDRIKAGVRGRRARA